MDAVREHEARYWQLVELAPDGILIHDGERITLANMAAVHLVGGTRREELVGQPVDRFLDPPFLKAVQHELTGPEDPSSGQTTPIRDALRRLDGSTIPVEIRSLVFMDDDRPSVHLVIRDIADRLAAEQRLRQAEDRLHAAQRMEAVGAVAGGVAHEINNMMAVVLGFADSLLRDPALPDELRDDARQIVRAGQRAALVTDQLLAFSRRTVYQPKVVDLGEAVRDNESVVRQLLGEDRHLDLVADGAPRVRIDPRQLDQIIVNLALNARDAMPAGGTLTLATSEVAVVSGLIAAGGDAIPVGRYGLLVAHDTGAGMDAAVQARIFEPFFTTKPVGSGSGLGLAASFGMIKQNGGYITVASAPGEGATFALYLPLVADAIGRERRERPRQTARVEVQGSLTVLVVEDEPSVRAIAVRVLELGGFRVLEAPDGAAALELAERLGPPDLVLSDVVMAGMSGPELARRLKDRWPDLPILFMSGYSTEELHRQGSAPSETVAFAKPFNARQLIERVIRALGRRPPVAARGS